MFIKNMNATIKDENESSKREPGNCTEEVPIWIVTGMEKINNGEYEKGCVDLYYAAQEHLRTYQVFPYKELLLEISEEFRDAMSLIEDLVWSTPDKDIRRDAITTHLEMLKTAIIENSTLENTDERYKKDQEFINSGINILEKLVNERVNEPDTLTPGSQEHPENIGRFAVDTRSCALKSLIEIAKFDAWNFDRDSYWRVINIIDEYLKDTSDELLWSYQLEGSIAHMSEIFCDLLRCNWEDNPQLRDIFIHFRDLLIQRSMQEPPSCDHNKLGAIKAFGKCFNNVDKDMSEEEFVAIYLPMIRFVDKFEGDRREHHKETVQESAIEILQRLPNTKAFNQYRLELYAFICKLDMAIMDKELTGYSFANRLGSTMDWGFYKELERETNIGILSKSVLEQIEMINKQYVSAQREFSVRGNATDLLYFLQYLIPRYFESDNLEVRQHAIKKVVSFISDYY